MTGPNTGDSAWVRTGHATLLWILGGVAVVLAVAHWWFATGGLYPASFVGVVGLNLAGA